MNEDPSLTPGTAQTARVGQSARSARVALIGRAGSGKTALAQAVFGTQIEPALSGGAQRYQDDAMPVTVDDLPGWTSGSESGLAALFAYLERARASDAPVDVIWYALDASAARVTDYEMQLIRRFAQAAPVVVALTRADLIAADACEAMQSAVESASVPNLLGVIPVAADPLPALGVAPYGVSEVMALTTARPQQPRAASQTPTSQTASQATSQTRPRPQASAERAADQPAATARRDAPSRGQYADYADERGYQSEAYAESEPGFPLSPALIAVVVAVAVAFALFLLGRRRRDDEDDE